MSNEALQGPEFQPLDEEWYKRYEELADFQDYEFLDGDAAKRAEERRAFEAREKTNPDLDYPKLHSGEIDLDAAEAHLMNFKHDILKSKSEIIEPHKFEVLKQVYRWKINEKIAEARLLKAARDGDSKRFARYSEFMYGKPSPEIYNYTVDSLRQDIEANRNSDNPTIKQAALDLEKVLPVAPPSDLKAGLPDQDTFDLAAQRTREDLKDIESIPIQNLEPETVKKAFELAMATLDASDWTVVLNPNKATFSVQQETKQVHIPPDYIKTVQECKAILYHEIGTHVARRLHGERSKLKLLGLGLDRYIKGEEGIATLREQVGEGKVEDYIHFDRFLAIALAKGIDGKPRDFREVYDILYPAIRLKELLKDQSEEAANEESLKQAWVITTRTFRGTDSKTRGACYTKDYVYRQGNMEAWDLVKKDISALTKVNLGKFDASDPRHMWILTELGIDDSDLDSLESEKWYSDFQNRAKLQ